MGYSWFTGTSTAFGRRLFLSARARSRSRFRPSSSLDILSAPPRARTTSVDPRGSGVRRDCTRGLRRRLMRLRALEWGTCRLPTMIPALVGRSSSTGRTDTTRTLLPDLPPFRRVVANPSCLVSRFSARSTSSPTSGDPRIRQRSLRDPCGGVPTEWPGRHAYACADGSRAPCADDGCSAGKYASSSSLLLGRTALRCQVKHR